MTAMAHNSVEDILIRVSFALLGFVQAAIAGSQFSRERYSTAAFYFLFAFELMLMARPWECVR